jgi:hypothetical protein
MKIVTDDERHVAVFARVIDVVTSAFWQREMPLNFAEAPGTIGK